LKRTTVIALFLLLPASLWVKNLLSFEQKKESSFPKKDVSTIEKSLYELANIERGKFGLLFLKISPELRLFARKHSQDMALQQNLSHLSPSEKSYKERLVDAGFYFISAGENVAFSETFVGEFIHQSFIESPEHKENIIDPDFDQVGIGITFVENKGYYITQNFLQSLEPQQEEKVKEEIKKKINNLRHENSLLPLLFIEEADKYARKYSLKKTEGRLPPPVPFKAIENQIIHISSPSLLEAYYGYKNEILDKTYKSAGLGVVFSRNKKYPGGAYFITFIFFVENKYKSWNCEKLKENVFFAVNKIRQKKERSKLNG